MTKESRIIDAIPIKDTNISKPSSRTLDVSFIPPACVSKTVPEQELGAVAFGEEDTSFFRVNVTKKDILRK